MTEDQKRRIDDKRPAVALEWDKPAAEAIETPAQAPATQWTILLTSAGHGLVHAYGQPFLNVQPHQRVVSVVDEAVVVELRERVRQLESELAAKFLPYAAAGSASPAAPCLTEAQFEEIAESWDGCEYQDAMIRDIGAALRADFNRLATPSSDDVRNAARDTQLLDFLETWLANNREEGWNEFHFAFDTRGTVREQVAEQMEIERQSAAAQSVGKAGCAT